MGLLGPTLGGSEKADVNYMAAIVIKSTSEPVEIRVQEQESLIKKKMETPETHLTSGEI